MGDVTQGWRERLPWAERRNAVGVLVGAVGRPFGPSYFGGVGLVYLCGNTSGVTRTSVVNLKGVAVPFA